MPVRELSASCARFDVIRSMVVLPMSDGGVRGSLRLHVVIAYVLDIVRLAGLTRPCQRPWHDDTESLSRLSLSG
jgi:hypothetical protein